MPLFPSLTFPSLVKRAADPLTPPTWVARVLTPGEGGDGADGAYCGGVALVMTGQYTPAAAAVDYLLNYVKEQGLSHEALVAVHEVEAGGAPGELPGELTGRDPVAAAMVLGAPGRSAMIFVSPVGGWRRVGAVALAARTAADLLDPKRTAMVQALLDLEQEHETQAVTQAGFQPLATLVYMHAPLRSERKFPNLTRLANELGPGVTVSTYDPARRSAFERAVEASYEGTLDCPGLLGLRSIGDVFEGHLTTGLFDPRLCWLVEEGGEGAGVLLLAGVREQKAHELVYLGLSPRWRGRGWAERLVAAGKQAAAAAGGKRLLLAVDGENRPAIGLYHKHGFTQSVRKRVMVRVVTS